MTIVGPNRIRRGTLKRILFAIALVAFLATGFLGLNIARQFISVAPDEVFQVSASVPSGLRQIKVEAYLPTIAPTGGHPAILFLHGVEGADRYRAAHTQSCRRLADQGYAVFYVHYFNAVDYQDLWHILPDGSLDKELIGQRCWADARCWSNAVISVVSAIARRPDVNAQRIALDGISLGGFISLEVANEALQRPEVPDVCAVVANWAAQFEITNCRAGFPPTLHIHGELDDVVPLQSAQRSVAEIQSVGSQAELFVIPRAPHSARSPESESHTREFLKRHLGTK